MICTYVCMYMLVEGGRGCVDKERKERIFQTIIVTETHMSAFFCSNFIFKRLVRISVKKYIKILFISRTFG